MAGDRTLTVKILGDASGAQKAFAKIEQASDGIGSKLGALAGALGKAFAAAGVAAGAFGVKAVLSASDLAETMSKVGVVFGDQQKIVTNFANQMAKDFGTPKREILDAAASIGLIGKASGLSQGDAAKMSTQLAKLATDAASFYNVPLPEALQAIQSGLVGEAEPMRRFGVLLNAQAVDAEAARLGLEKVGKEYTEGAKAQARASLIMSGMKDASGDLERTQGSLANRLKELRGRAENFAADVGTKLLPVVLAAMDLFEKWGGILSEKVGPIVEAIKGGIMAMFAAFKAGDGDVTSNGFAGTMERIGNVARSVVEWFKANWPAIQRTIADVFNWIKTNIVPVVVAIATEIARKFGEVVQWVRDHWPQISEAIRHVVNVIRDIFSALAAFMQPLWDNIRGVIEAAIKIIQGIIQTVLAVINGDWGKAWNGIKQVLAGVWDGIKNIVGGAIDAIVGILKGVGGRISAIAGGMFDGIKNAFKAAINFIIRGWNSIQFKVPSFKVGPIEFGGFTLGLPDIPQLAHGGIVRARPGGTLALIGEAGQDEAVIPLPRNGGAMAAAATYVTVHVAGSVVTERDLIDAVASGLEAKRRRNGPGDY